MGEQIELTARIIIEQFPKVHENTEPYFVLVSTILSQRSRDENTEKAAYQLFEDGWDVYDIAAKQPEQLYERIKPAGLYRQKSINIIETSKMIIKEHDGKVPSTIEQLTQFPGVGRKTANIVLWVSFSIPAMAVDTHVHRIGNRLGWIETKNPTESEFALMEVLSKDLWGPINGSMVEFGKAVCQPRKPLCDMCPISRYCEFFNKGQAS